jgi:predicted dehydrogenase
VAKAGVVLGVSFQRRFHPSMIELKRRVRSGALGTIDYVTAEMTTSSALGMPPGYWRTDPSEAPAGAMTGIGVHLVDGMIDLFGEIESVYCLNARRAAPHADDTTSVMMKFKSGMPATFTGCFATVPGYRFEVAGSGGTGEITGHFLQRLVVTPMPKGPYGTAPKDSETIDTPGYNMLGAALDAFADAVAQKKPFAIPPEQIRHGVAVFEAIVKSAASGQVERVGT